MQGRLSTALSRGLEPGAAGAESLAEALAELRRLMPPALVGLVADVLAHVRTLPDTPPPERASGSMKSGRPAPMTSEQLPAWLGPRRTIGAFWVERTLGDGGNASVFVARRADERHEEAAERFALKVPDYDGAAARALSEKEFLDIFRAEATALLALPPAPNLARFVSFDLAARPKPILVMELIDGPTLERHLGALRARSAGGPTSVFASGADGVADPQSLGALLGTLDGIAAGLSSMHAHGVGHLDLKPSNVILRGGLTPTLVDFGLAGRQIRPGCGTAPYCAPEVWGALPDDFVGAPTPAPADVYAFGALFYETLTGETLFTGDSELAIAGRHLAHDGHPPALDALSHVRPVVELLEHMLRRDPRRRWTIDQVRAAIRAIRPAVEHLRFPLA